MASSSQALPSLNILILPHLFLRCQTDWGVGILGFMAYLSISFSTYALSRRYAWPPTAATASIIVLSLPRLVYLSTSPGHEIIPTATALFCLLALFRAVESPNLPNDRGFDTFKGHLAGMMNDYYTHLYFGEIFLRENNKLINPEGHATELFTNWAIEYLNDKKSGENPFFLYRVTASVTALCYCA